MKLAEQLKNHLASNSMTASQLAKISGVPKQTLSDWLKGSSPKNIGSLKKVASVFGISVDELCFGEFNKSAGEALGSTSKDNRSNKGDRSRSPLKKRK